MYLTTPLPTLHATRALADWILERPGIRHAGMREAWARFQRQDWGDCCPSDRESNDADWKAQEGRVLAVYTIDGRKVWLHWTAHEGIVALFPEDY
jgi:hypothetical protein